MYFLKRSALSRLPFGINDPNTSTYAGRKQLDVHVGELVVDLYNGAKTANLRRGALQPNSVPAMIGASCVNLNVFFLSESAQDSSEMREVQVI